MTPTNSFERFDKTQIEQSTTDRFEYQVRRFPDKIAVKTTEDEVSYSQLNRRANQIAWSILQNCGEKNIPVSQENQDRGVAGQHKNCLKRNHFCSSSPSQRHL